MPAGAIVAVFARFRRFAPDQLVEIALLTARGLFLVDKREIGFVEFLEERLPGDLFERRILGVGRIRELDADNTGIVFAMRLADRRRTPAARWGVGEDMAGIAVFLASSASDFITGTAIPVDGGYSIQV